MWSISRNMIVAIVGLVILSILNSACTSGSGPAIVEFPETEHMEEGEDHVKEEEEHLEGEGHMEDEMKHMEGEEFSGNDHMDAHSPDDHLAGAHDVPDDVASVPNPIAKDEESQSIGAELYALHCAVCHGETGEGDGPAAASLAKVPADLHEAHVQGLTDGALFHIITHGKPETPMPAWEDTLTEEERWHVVNFLRSLR